MKPSDALDPLATEPAERARLAEAGRAAAAAVERQPDLAALRVVASRPATTAELVERRLRPWFADTGWVQPLLADLRDLVCAEPLTELPLVATQGGLESALTLVASPAVTISLVSRRAGRDGPGVRLGGRMVLARPLTGRVRAQCWAGAPIDADFRGLDAPPLCPGRWRTVADGTTLRVDGRRQGVLLHTDRPAALLRATIHAGKAPLARAYNGAGRLTGASATDEGASRLAMLATMVADMGRADAVPALELLLDQPDFSLRWLAARLLIRLNGARGRFALLRLADHDPHPEVRAAASAALARVDSARLAA